MLLGAFPIGGKNDTTNTHKKRECRFILLCGGYILLLILGAAMFSAIEAPKIDEISRRVETFRNQFLQEHSCLSAAFQEMSDESQSSSTFRKLDRSIRKKGISSQFLQTNLDARKCSSAQCIASLKHFGKIQKNLRLSSSDTALNILNEVPDFPKISPINYRKVPFIPNCSTAPPFVTHRSSVVENLYKKNGEDVDSDLREKTRRWRNIWLCFYIFFFIFYLLLGAMGFRFFEIPTELRLRTKIRQRVDAFLSKYPQIKDSDLEDFLQAVITANDRGISPLRNASNEMNWSFGQALFFSSTVVTTIGYGHVTPLSQTGKIFCMIYAAIGIPLTLVLITAIVDRLLIPTNWLLGFLNKKFGHLYQPFNIRLLHLSIIVFLVLTFFFAIPTALFAYIEPNWGVLDAFYYCFISLTTIGLGDYIPGGGVSPESHSIYKICITCYLIFGLISMMLVLTIFYDIPQLNLGQLFTESTSGELEKLRLSASTAANYSGGSSIYMSHAEDDNRRSIVRIRPHGNDSPSPEDTPTLTSRNKRIP